MREAWHKQLRTPDGFVSRLRQVLELYPGEFSPVRCYAIAPRGYVGIAILVGSLFYGPDPVRIAAALKFNRRDKRPLMERLRRFEIWLTEGRMDYEWATPVKGDFPKIDPVGLMLDAIVAEGEIDRCPRTDRARVPLVFTPACARESGQRA